MQQRELFIIVPSLEASGPVKGAIATANLLADEYKITFISLKQHKNNLALLPNSQNINFISLAPHSWIKKLVLHRKLLKQSYIDYGNKPISLSFCFSADFFNSFHAAYATTVSSLRNNFFKDYKFLYGYMGYFVAIFHALILNCFSKVYVMTSSMSEAVNSFLFRKPSVIPNFIDEQHLTAYKKCKKNENSTVELIFVGTLTERKQPIELLEAFNELVNRQVNVHLTYLGDGPLFEGLQAKIKRLGLDDKVRVMGFISSPYKIISQSDILVLPSLSEGISRASLESLYLGLPCVLRDVDGNSEVVSEKHQNGVLFGKNIEMADAIMKAIKIYQAQPEKNNLLPIYFHRTEVKKLLMSLFD
jgi:glycosyltransferase involved in cell wall biosynthesis